MKEFVSKMDRRQDSSCKPCPFSAPETNDNSDPVHQSPPRSGDSNCFATCRDAFLLSLDESSLDANGSITEEGCQYLGDNGEGGELFHALYYLDITYCGLGRVGGSGHDREFTSCPLISNGLLKCCVDLECQRTSM